MSATGIAVYLVLIRFQDTCAKLEFLKCFGCKLQCDDFLLKTEIVFALLVSR